MHSWTHGQSRQPPGLVDIHCHLLPGVDDGVETLAEAVELLRVAHRQGVRRVVERMREAGYWPMLAHIERYPVLRDRPERLTALVEVGAILQINAHSLLHWGGGLRRRCFDLLKNGLAQIVASDAHNPSDRRPNLGPVREVLAKKFSHEHARAWLSERPAQALDGPRPTTA